MLVVYFSRAGENYGVGVVAEGNTSRLARAVADEAGAALVEIVPDTSYPSGYDAAKAVIQRELEEDARPPVTLRVVRPIGGAQPGVDGSVMSADSEGRHDGDEDVSGACDVPPTDPSDPDRMVDTAAAIALGYPIWCGSLPMPVRTFLDAHNWDGKRILPFCTHGGSGLARTMDELRTAAPGADIRDGLPVLGADAQRDPDAVRPRVGAWLRKSS